MYKVTNYLAACMHCGEKAAVDTPRLVSIQQKFLQNTHTHNNQVLYSFILIPKIWTSK